jgi:hypothetical protein
VSARVDASDFSTVVWCTDCPEWSESARDRSDGHDRAERHEKAVHPGCRVAEINRYKYLKKLAA